MADDAFNWYPAPAFYFQVQVLYYGVQVGSAIDGSFSEVSGIEVKIETETIQEGGLNMYAWKVPGGMTHSNLILKRGLPTEHSLLKDMIKMSLTPVYSQPILPVTLMVTLMNEQGNPLSGWAFFNAYPVRWKLSDLDAQRNEVAIEEMEFTYTFFKEIDAATMAADIASMTASLLL